MYLQTLREIKNICEEYSGRIASIIIERTIRSFCQRTGHSSRGKVWMGMPVCGVYLLPLVITKAVTQPRFLSGSSSEVCSRMSD